MAETKEKTGKKEKDCVCDPGNKTYSTVEDYVARKLKAELYYWNSSSTMQKKK